MDKILDEDELTLKEAIAGQEADPNFDILWMLNIVKIALEKLKKECEGNKTPYYLALEIYLNEGSDYKTIAQKLGKNIHDIKNYIHRART